MSVEFLALFGTVFAALSTGAGAVWILVKGILIDYKAELKKRDEDHKIELKKRDDKIAGQEKEKNELAKVFQRFQSDTRDKITHLEVEMAKMHTIRDIGELFERTLIKIISPIKEPRKSKEKVKK